MFFRLLPWEYAIRNLFRRPLRTSLTFFGLTTVIVLVFVVVGFIRGLERSLAVSGDPQTAVIFSLGMGENLEYSSIRHADERSGSGQCLAGFRSDFGQKYVSPELYLGTQVRRRVSREDARTVFVGLVRGVTRVGVTGSSPEWRSKKGDWPETGEVMVGRHGCCETSERPQAEIERRAVDCVRGSYMADQRRVLGGRVRILSPKRGVGSMNCNRR